MKIPKTFIFEYKGTLIHYINYSHVKIDELKELHELVLRLTEVIVRAMRGNFGLIDARDMVNTPESWKEQISSLSNTAPYIDKLAIITDKNNNELVIKNLFDQYTFQYGLFKTEKEALEYLIRQ